MLLAIMHFTAVANVTSGNTRFNNTTIIVNMVLFWFIPPGILLIIFTGHSAIKGGAIFTIIMLQMLEFRIFVVTLFVGALVLMVCLHTRLICILSAAEKHFRRECRSVSAQFRRKRHALRTTVTILSTFFVAWIATSVVYLLMSFQLRDKLFGNKPILRFALNYGVNLMLMLKFMLNPLIYAARIPEVREAISSCRRSYNASYSSGATFLRNSPGTLLQQTQSFVALSGVSLLPRSSHSKGCRVKTEASTIDIGEKTLKPKKSNGNKLKLPRFAKKSGVENGTRKSYREISDCPIVDFKNDANDENGSTHNFKRNSHSNSRCSIQFNGSKKHNTDKTPKNSMIHLEENSMINLEGYNENKHCDLSKNYNIDGELDRSTDEMSSNSVLNHNSSRKAEIHATQPVWPKNNESKVFKNRSSIVEDMSPGKNCCVTKINLEKSRLSIDCQCQDNLLTDLNAQFTPKLHSSHPILDIIQKFYDEDSYIPVPAPDDVLL